MHDDVYQMYLDEIRLIPACTLREEQILPLRAKEGDEEARKRLLEGMLHYAVELAGKYKNRGLLAGDLVQEANMGLIMAVDRYESGDFRQYAKTVMTECLEAAVAEQKREAQVSEELVARVNVLKDISAMMAEDLGREASVEELAQKMKMTADEIKDIMKLTLDAMSVSPDAEI